MSTQSPLFSIIIPTYNRAHLIGRAIQSVIDQSYSDWELIIVDDGSTDDTIGVVKSFSDARIFYNYCDHLERSQARNYGISLANGKFICFLDDDDWLDTEYLLSFKLYYENIRNEEVILRTGFKVFTNSQNKYSVNYKPDVHKNPIAFATFNWCGIWSLCIPSIFLKDEKFPIKFPYWEDTHLIIRLLLKHPFIQLSNYNYNYNATLQMQNRNIKSIADLDKMLIINIKAMEDLFDTYKNKLYLYLPSNAKNKIIARKYIHYASMAIDLNFYKTSIRYLVKSIKIGIYRYNLGILIFVGLRLLNWKSIKK